MKITLSHSNYITEVKQLLLSGVKDNNYPELQGIIPRSAEHIFQHIAQSQDQQYLVYCSYVQIYQVRLETRVVLLEYSRLGNFLKLIVS